MVSAWSIGTALRDRGKSNDTPGPGAYQAEKLQKVNPPNYKIGSSVRSPIVLNGSPGPGTYEAKGRIGVEGSKYTLLGKPQNRPLTSEPGPGAYNPNVTVSMKSLPRYTISGKYNLTNREKTPGPGTYSHQSTVANRPSMMFPRSQREGMFNNKVPGPGAYSRNAMNSTDGPKYGFGTSARDEFYATNKAPGPGNYQLNSSFDQARGVSMSFRQKTQEDGMIVPGPGSYNPMLTTKKSAPSFRIGTAQRDQLGSDISQPGPGAYEAKMYNRPTTPAYKLGSDQRRPLGSSEKTPGPGSYAPSNTNTSPKPTIKGAGMIDPIILEKSRVPGPGQYMPNDRYSSNRHRALSAKIGSSQRSNFVSATAVPGPGNYAQNNSPEGPKWGFGTSQQRIDDKVKYFEGQPGPGQYTLKPFFADVPSYLLQNKPTTD